MKGKKSRVLLLGVLILGLTSGAAFAANQTGVLENIINLPQQWESASRIKDYEAFQKQKEAQDFIAANQITEYLNESILDNSMLSVLKANGLSEDEIQIIMEEYTNFLILCQATEKELAAIAAMVRDGRDLRKIIQIYEYVSGGVFDMNLIQDIYEIGEKVNFRGQYWLANAYDSVMGTTDEALTGEDIRMYMEKGISVEEIQVANELRKNQKLTIREILDRRLAGENWTNLFNACDSSLSMKEDVFGNAEVEVLHFYRQLKHAVKMDENSLFTNSNGQPNQAMEIYLGELFEAKEAFLQQHNLKHKINNKTITAAKPLLQEQGITEDEIDELTAQGFSAKEIQKAATLSSANGKSLKSILGAYQHTGVWEENTKEGSEK